MPLEKNPQNPPLRQTDLSFNEVLSFITENDLNFEPPLSSRIGSLEKYVDKLFLNATFFHKRENGNLVAIVATYLNDFKTKVAYISYVYVKSDYRKKGIAKRLLLDTFKKAKQAGMREIKLEVLSANTEAKILYTGLGFTEVEKSSFNSVYMKLSLEFFS